MPSPTPSAASARLIEYAGAGVPPFDGVTGLIAFDARGDVPAKPVVIGVVRGGRLVTEAAP